MPTQQVNQTEPFTNNVVVTVINWNDADATLNCLESVFSSNYPNFEVVVIDNGSTHDPHDLLLSRFPAITYIRNSQNIGYTGANNQGMTIAMERGAEFVWLVNNDATVDPKALPQLVQCMKTDNLIGMASPIVIDISQPKSNYCGSFMDPKTLRYLPSKSIEEFESTFSLKPCEVVLVGAAIFIRTEAIRMVGLLDQRFFAYYEDFDYSLRMTEHGWINTICGTTFVQHQSSKPNRKPHYFYYMARNGLLFVQNHATKQNRSRLVRGWFSYNLKKAANHIAISKNQDAAAIVDGIWNAWKRNFGSFEQRRPTPIWLKKILLWHPYFLAKLLSG